MSVTRLFVIAALLLVGLGETAPAANPASAQTQQNPAAVVRLSGEVDDYSRDMLFRRFRDAEAAGAKTVILEIDTYGGLVTSGMDISRFLRGQTALHTIAFVDNKAISAGAMIAMACDEIVMTPGAVLGDCAPIRVDATGRMDPLPVAERAKMQSPILRDFEDSARKNGYDPLLAEAMVRVESSVYLVQDAAGHDRVVNEEQFKTLTAQGGQWKPAAGISNPVDGSDTLLTVGPDLARRLGLSRATTRSIGDLAAQRGFQIVADLTPNFADHLVEAFNGTWARFILLVVFLLSLYIALHAPGHGAAEAFAVVSLGLLVGVPLLTGFAQWWEIVLVIVGLALCAFEIFVFPGHGVSLGLGVVMVLIGLLMTFAGKDPAPGWFPHSHETWTRLGTGLRVMMGAVVASVIGAALLRPFLPRMPLFRKLILTETNSGPLPAAAGLPLKAGDEVWPFIGTVGVAVSDLKPGGVVRFPYGSDTRTASVVSVSGYLQAGGKVVVQEARGNRIVVRVA